MNSMGTHVTTIRHTEVCVYGNLALNSRWGTSWATYFFPKTYIRMFLPRRNYLLLTSAVRKQ